MVQFDLPLLQSVIDCFPFLGFRFAPPQAEISPTLRVYSARHFVELLATVAAKSAWI
jgi:hypothetical protein